MSTTKENARRMDAASRKWRAQRDPYWLYTSMDPDAVFWRVNQAQVDADIEGLARDEVCEAFVRDMDAAGVSPEDQIERLKAYFQERDRAVRHAAAE